MFQPLKSSIKTDKVKASKQIFDNGQRKLRSKKSKLVSIKIVDVLIEEISNQHRSKKEQRYFIIEIGLPKISKVSNFGI